MKIQVSIAVPTQDIPNPKGWRTVAREMVELDVTEGKEQAIKEKMNKICSGCKE